MRSGKGKCVSALSSCLGGAGCLDLSPLTSEDLFTPASANWLRTGCKLLLREDGATGKLSRRRSPAAKPPASPSWQ